MMLSRGSRRLSGWLAMVARRLVRCGRGATAVEFALTAPILFLMLAGIMEGGRAYWIKSTMQFALEETARYAIVNASAGESELETEFLSKMVGFPDAGSITFSANLSASGGVNYMEITSQYTFTPFAGALPASWSAMSLSAKARIPVS